ncbi:MAG TPA: tetratricopeptide repeat protein [Thermoanaerobaculia bacterium]|jgi:cytochrome c-type biogenesis protein CcmH/NrfG
MRRAFTSSLVVLVALLALAGCRSATNPAEAETQRRFGVQMAKMNLWREAMFRFRRAAEMNPNDAMAYNNLAVAYEANGDFDNALKAYREALRLDRSNQYIAKNYSRFVEFTSRDKKRPGRVTTNATTTAAATSTATTPATTTTAPPATTTQPPAVGAPPADTTAAPPATTTTNPPEAF